MFLLLLIICYSYGFWESQKGWNLAFLFTLELLAPSSKAVTSAEAVHLDWASSFFL
jgi:hypothetical protein